MAFDLLIDGGIVVTMEAGASPFIGSIGITGDRIEVIREGRMPRTSCNQYIDASGMIVIPGLINGHVHGDITIAKGIGDDQTLLEQDTAFAPLHFLYEWLTPRDRFISRQLTYVEALKAGTTFVCENMYWGMGADSLRAMQEVGICGALVEDARPDFTAPDNFMSAEAMRGLSDAVRQGGLVPVVGSVSEEHFTPDRLKSIKNLAEKSDALITLHLAETTWRLEHIQKTFGTTPVRFLDQNDYLSSRVIGSHAVYIDQEEIKILAQKGVKIVNTPVAEMKIADGIAPIPQYLEHGIVVGLGTDGALWNNCADLFREMKALVLLHNVNSGIRALTALDALKIATINGATVFGLENDMGSLKPGKLANITLVETHSAHMRPLRLHAHANVLSNLVYCATGSDVHSVIVRGKLLVLNHQVKSLDEAKLVEEAQAISERIAALIPADAFKQPARR